MSDSKLMTIKDKLQLFLTACGVLSILFAVFAKTTEKLEIIVTADKLHEHNEGAFSHPPLQGRLETCEESVKLMAAALEEYHKDQVALGARLVRTLAAEQEPNARLRAAAANYYEQEYRLLINKGNSVEDAMLEALRSHWYSRPRL